MVIIEVTLGDDPEGVSFTPRTSRLELGAEEGPAQEVEQESAGHDVKRWVYFFDLAPGNLQ